MRIKSIRLSWFRGAAKIAELAPQGHSLAVYGPNGAGKSSFVDAVEYVMNDGKVGHLRHDEAGRLQEKGIPNTHTPTGQQTEFTVTFTDDTQVQVKIATNGTHKKSGAQAINMSGWNYPRTALRQNEVADFISSRKGEKYSALLPLLGLGDLEFAAENFHQLARTIEQQSRLGQKQGQLQATTARREAAFGDDSDAVIEAKVADLHKRYCPGSKAEDIAARCKELSVAVAKRVAELTAENRRHLELRMIADCDIAAAIQAVRDADGKLAGSVEPLINEKLEILQASGVFAEKLTTEKKIDCPACGRSIAAADFKTHVTSEHDRLEEIIAVFVERRAAVGIVVDILKAIKNAIAGAPLETWRDALKAGVLKVHAEWIEQIDPESLRHAMRPENLKAIETHCFPIMKEAGEASQNAPPDIQELSRDKDLVDAATAVCEVRELSVEIARIQALSAFLAAAETGAREEIRVRAEAVITGISDDVSEMWKVLHPGSPIENVHLYLPEDDKAIDIGLRFYGKDQDSPRLTLSEGYRNSLGLCIFLAMAKREAAADRPLFLDDVVVSFDRQHRGMIVELLAQQFADRQVIVFTHDRDWFSDLRRQLDAAKWGFRIMRPYETPLIGESRSRLQRSAQNHGY